MKTYTYIDFSEDRFYNFGFFGNLFGKGKKSPQGIDQGQTSNQGYDDYSGYDLSLSPQEYG